MSQEIYSLDTTKEVRDIIPKMQKTIESGLSNLSGTMFPTTNLVVGMQCYRTDLKRMYVLESASPATWKTIASINKMLIPAAGDNINKFYPVQIFMGRNSVNIYRHVHQDAEWRGACDLTIFSGSGWGYYADPPYFFYSYAWSGDTDIYNTIKKIEISEKDTSLIIWLRGTCTFTLSGIEASYSFPKKINEDTYRVEVDGDYDEYKTIVAGATGDGIADGIYYNGTILLSNSDAATTNASNKLVKRDASGNFSAGTITASLAGNATTASNANALSGLTLAPAKTAPPTTATEVHKVVRTDGDGWLRAYRIDAQYFMTRAANESTTPTRIFASTDNYIRPITPANVKVGALLTPRKISLIGSVTGNVDFDGSGNVSINTTIALNNIFVKQNTAPTNTAVLWINTTDRTLNYHNGSGWVQIVGVYSDA